MIIRNIWVDRRGRVQERVNEKEGKEESVDDEKMGKEVVKSGRLEGRRQR